MLCLQARHFIHFASVDSFVKLVPGGDNLEKGVQCYELFGGIAFITQSFFDNLMISMWCLTVCRSTKIMN